MPAGTFLGAPPCARAARDWHPYSTPGIASTITLRKAISKAICLVVLMTYSVLLLMDDGRCMPTREKGMESALMFGVTLRTDQHHVRLHRPLPVFRHLT